MALQSGSVRRLIFSESNKENGLWSSATKPTTDRRSCCFENSTFTFFFGSLLFSDPCGSDSKNIVQASGCFRRTWSSRFEALRVWSFTPHALTRHLAKSSLLCSGPSTEWMNRSHILFSKNRVDSLRAFLFAREP